MTIRLTTCLTTWAVILVLAFPVLANATAFNDPGSRTQGGAAGAGGDMVPVEKEIQGGEISVGSTAQVVVLFRNDSGRPITTGAIQLYPSSTVSASVSLNQCSQEELPAGAVCAVAISVKGLQAGTWRVEMLMRHSGRARISTASMDGQVQGGDTAASRFISDIEAIPDELDFGEVKTSQSVVKGIVLRNITSEPIDINAVYVEAAARAGYSLRTDCGKLEAGQACIVILTWSPVLKGTAGGVLLVDHTGPTKVASINLTGNYAPEKSVEAEAFPEPLPGKGLLVASQKEVDFGSGIVSTSAITVSLVNVGDAPLTVADIRLGNPDNGLSISKGGCAPGLVLEPVEACPMTVTWSPVREGSILDDIQVVHDGARGVLVLPVKGKADQTISQDTKAIRLSDATTVSGNTANLPPGDTSAEREVFPVRDDTIDPASVLNGFVVTSHSPKRSIISGPGGSRIVFDGEEVVVGGFVWNVIIRASGVEFRSGNEKVLLLFDRSLSSVNRGSSQSGSSSGGSSSGSGSTSSSSTSSSSASASQ